VPSGDELGHNNIAGLTSLARELGDTSQTRRAA
jgi:hypothetical protein